MYHQTFLSQVRLRGVPIQRRSYSFSAFRLTDQQPRTFAAQTVPEEPFQILPRHKSSRHAEKFSALRPAKFRPGRASICGDAEACPAQPKILLSDPKLQYQHRSPEL